MNQRTRFISFLLVVSILLSTLYLPIGATETPESTLPVQEDTKTLVDVIQEKTTSSLIEHLQKRIDETFLPGYKVEGKPVLEIFTGYNWHSTDKSLKNCLQYSAGKDRIYMIFDNSTYYALHDYNGENLNYEKNVERWEILYELIENENATMELCGRQRLVTEITCFDTVDDGLVIYFQTEEGVFIRHYGWMYEYKPKLAPRDYTLDEFVQYTNQYTSWMKRESENRRIQGIKGTGRRSFSGYMKAGAATPAPLIQPQRPFVSYILILLACMVVIACCVTGVLIYRRKRRCAS